MPPTSRWPFRNPQAALGRFGKERLIEAIIRERERHVHARAVAWLDAVGIEARCVDRGVQQVRLFDIAQFDCRHSTLFTQPFQYQVGNVDRIRRRGVVAGMAVSVRLVVQHRRPARRAMPDRSSRTTTTVSPAGPKFFCAPANRSDRNGTHRSVATGSATTCRRPAARPQLRHVAELESVDRFVEQ